MLGGAATATLVARGNGSEPGVSTWLCRSGDGQLLIQWPDRGGVINGSYHEAGLTGTAPNQQVSTNSGAVSGQSAGHSINLDLGKGTWYGSIHGNRMTLNIPQQDGSIQPQSCQHSSTDAWNASVADLGTQASGANASANAAAVQQQQAQDLANAQQSLASDVTQLATDAAALDNDKTLAADVQTASKDLATEQNDWVTEQHDSCGHVSTDSDTVSSDADAVSSDGDAVASDVTSVNDTLSGVQKDTSSVQADLTAINGQSGSSQTDPAPALAAGKKAVADTQKAIAWANQQGSALVATSKAIATQASDFATARGC